MSLKKYTLIMECALVLFALLDLSRLVYSQGEPGSNPDEEGAPSSITSNLFPAVSATPSRAVNFGKSTVTKFSAMASAVHSQTPGAMESEAQSTSHVYERSIAASVTLNARQSSKVMESQAGTATDIPSVTKSQTVLQSRDTATSLGHAIVSTSSGTRISSVQQSPIVMQSQAPSATTRSPSAMQSQAPIATTKHPSAKQSPTVIQTQAAMVSHKSTATDTSSATQTHHAQTGTVVTSVYHLLSVSTLDISQSQAHTMSTVHVTTLLPSVDVRPQSTFLMQQNTSHVLVSPHTSLSTQVPATKRDGSSTSQVAASQSLDVVNMTAKGSLSSVTPSGLASYSSSQLLTSSVAMTDGSVFTSQDLIHPTSSVQATWHQSSSLMLPPPTTSPSGPPGLPVIQVTTVLSANSILLKWNTTSVQFGANFSVELSVDSISWKQAKCNQSLVQGACIVTETETTVTRLKAYTNYTFRVVAQNLFGRSNYSMESKWVVTNEAAPSGAPTITAAYNLSAQEIFVAWQPPQREALNGKLRKYELRLTEVNAQPTTLPPNKSSISSMTSSPMSSTPVPTTPSDGGYPVTEPPEPTEGSMRRKRQIGLSVVKDVGLVLSFRVANLKIWTSYEVEVRAVTVAPGPFSKKVTVRTDEDVPRQPTHLSANVVNSTAIFVNWTEPAKMNGVLVKYQVTYSKKNSSKSVTRDVGKAESTLLSSLNPFTLYTISVSAFTSKGEGNHSTVLEQTDEGQPSPPQNLSTHGVNSTAILVTWQQPANPNGKIKYRLSFNTGSGLVSFMLVYDGESTQFLVSKLKPFTQYSFKLTAYNLRYNLSSSSVVAMKTTDQAAPSGPPQNVRAITNSSSSILLHWMPPKVAEQNGEITRYNINISSSVPQHSMLWNTVGNTTVSAITGLQAYTNYSFRVQAVTGGGIGPYSSAVTNKTFEAEPSPPRNITAKSVNSTAIKVAWVQALRPNGVIHYKLYIRLSKDDESMNRMVYEGIDTAFVVSGLQEYVMYSFTVVSFNVKYAWTSKPVVAMETTHPAEPSGPPQDVQALTVSPTSVQVKWSPPLRSERNGIIKHYSVLYSNTSQLGESGAINTTDNSTSIVASGLAIFMKYSFAVKAWNVVGAGPESELVYNTTLQDRPSPPTNIAAHTVNSSAIKVMWQTPLNPNGEIQYRLYYWQSSEGFGTRTLVYDGPEFEYVVAELHEYVTYTFMVQAHNVKYSWNSSAVNASETTHPAEPSGPPLDVVALTETSTSILVKWSPPSELDRNGFITHYIVKYNVSLGKEANITTSDNSTQYLVPQLRKYSPYNFTVQAVNKIGVGPPSVAVVNVTFEDVPGQPVIERVNATSDSLEVMWKPPEEANGIIKTFELCWSLATEVPNKNCTVLKGATRSYEISNLKAFSQYTVSLAARTSAGLGPAFVKDYKTAEGVPSKPQDLRGWNTSENSILVTWKRPVNINGELKGYQVFYRLAYSTDQYLSKPVRLHTNTTLVLLTPYTLYEVRVQAFTGAGGGDMSLALKVITDETKPSKVASVMINQSINSMGLSWTPPSEPNGKIGYYLSYWKTSVVPSVIKTFVLAGSVGYKSVSNLKAYTSYTFSVVAYNLRKNVSGPPYLISGMTKATAPSGPPQKVVILKVTSTSLTLSWDPPLKPNGKILSYDVRYYEKDKPDKKTVNDNLKGLTHRITELESWRYYRIQVACQSSGGIGPYSNWTEKRTLPRAPSGPPQKVVILKVTSTSLTLSWDPPLKPNGKILSYDVRYYEKDKPDKKTVNDNVKGLTHTITELESWRYYRIQVACQSSGGLGPYSNWTENRTLPGAPSGPPQKVVILKVTSTSLTLSWDPPLKPNGKILSYDVRYYEKDKPDKKTVNDNVKGLTHTITELESWRYYRIQVACQSSGGLGPYSNWTENRTLPGVPPPLGTLAPPDKETVNSVSFKVKLTKASNEKGDVRYYQVIVIELATDNTGKAVPARNPDDYKAENLYTYEEARKRKPQLVPYIAVEFSAEDFDDYQSFTVGDGRRTRAVTEDVSTRRRKRQEDGSSEFYNGPLEGDTFYSVFQRAYVNKDFYTSSSWIEPVETAAAISPTEAASKSNNVGLVVGLILVIVIICILIIVGIIYVRRKRTNFDRVLDDTEDYSNGQPVRMKKLSRKRKSLQKRLMGSTESLDGLEDMAASRARRQPVPIDDFERHVDRMHMDGDHGFSEEYALVQPDDEFSFQQFLNPANKYKNRYANIVAYDHSRVLLNPIEGIAGSDYMNANFIDGYNRQRAYIAAQGPLMETFDDFWRMMWEQMSSVIVMLTKLEERGRRKCDQYWPERGTKGYGPIQVTLKETLHMSHYTVRKFVMKHKKYPDDERIVKQFHFTAWPDHGVPSHPTPLLSLVRHTNSANRESVGPMVVHCSAGVGRTGTFITLDVMLQRISQEDSVDVFGFVRQMRYQRNFMVQTEAQYVFIHDALLEAITCGVTEVEAKDLGSRIRELRQIDPETGYTYLENEFCRLAKEENHPIAFKSASLNCNAAKNRYANILPFESTRVHLKMRPGEMGSDYINANFIDGYCQPRAYIATQAPVPDTFEDFWRLTWEQESASVVMLTREEEAGKVKCHHYWPSEGSRLYGVILVELLEEGSFGDYISRKFKLTHTEAKESRTVQQFQYTDWPDTGLPESGVGIVDLIGQVQKWQQQSGNTVIVIHCSGGVGRTGVFCGISMMIERLKAEGVIDVFQTVQAMRLQRPAMVQTAEQYEFCYTTLQEYLDSFDLYANFQ